MCVFSISDGEFDGKAPYNSGPVEGGRKCRGGLVGDAIPPSKINDLMSVSVGFGIYFGSVGFATASGVKLAMKCMPIFSRIYPSSDKNIDVGRTFVVSGLINL